ncbi:MAG: M6 family metalloprotease domain-containing protein, partial [Candidatus Cloacimonetes bacterium]|nr:M6 family metalloprotease domain-containing protein [Candidatus Cloacimonadota bacterium]
MCKNILFTSLFLILFVSLFSAYLENLTTSITQPDGTKLECFMSGDEYLHHVYDANGYTLLQDPKTGWVVYADKVGENLVPTDYIFGQSNPEETGLTPYLKWGKSVYDEKRNSFMSDGNREAEQSRSTSTTGNVNFITIFIRFSDQSEYTTSSATWNNMLNANTGLSLKNYYRETSNNQLNLTSTILPNPSGGVTVSFQDSHPRNYYLPYSSTNLIGYQGEYVGYQRLQTMLRDAIIGVQSQVPTGTDYDSDNDSFVDNLVFIVQGGPNTWGTPLWPHNSSLVLVPLTLIGGSIAGNYNLQLSDICDVPVLCHEMGHCLGMPDLYRYTESTPPFSPVSSWDLMSSQTNPPQHTSPFMKWKYLNWFNTLPQITTQGTYTLQPVSTSPFACYKIAAPNNPNEYFILEYRKQEGNWDTGLPNQGLIIRRIVDGIDGNAGGPPDEVYVYRPNGTGTVNGDIADAPFSSTYGRAAFNNLTNPTPFLSDGSDSGLVITNITAIGNTISFTVLNDMPQYWTGNFNNNWHDSRNWSTGSVPNINDDVDLPSGPARQPYIYNGNAVCKTLRIETGQSLHVQGHSLTIDGGLTLWGGLELQTDDALCTVDGDVFFHTGCNISMVDNSTLDVKGNISASTGANVSLDAGIVKMSGWGTAWISVSGGNNIEFWNLQLWKSNSTVYFGGEFTGELVVKGDLVMANGCNFNNESDNNNVRIHGNLETDGSFRMDYGTLYTELPNSTLDIGFGYLNNLTVNHGTLGLESTHNVVKGDLTINYGTLESNNKTIELFGNWNNTRGVGAFLCEGGGVCFSGSDDQTCSSETFHILMLSKSAGNINIGVGSSVTCDQYEWTGGTMVITGGHFTALDLVNYSVEGDYIVSSGGMDLQQDSILGVDFNANMTISNQAIVNIKGGNGNPSRWAYTNDINLTLSGGTLSFEDTSIEMGNYGHTATCNISGGIIKTTGDFIHNYGTFQPTGGSVQFVGTGTANAHTSTNGVFHNLIINKSSSSRTERVNGVIFDGDTTVANDLTVLAGTLELDDAELSIGGNLSINGNLTLNEADEIINVDGNVTWANLSLPMLTSGTMNVKGNWSNMTNFTALIESGFNLVFTGNSNSEIISTTNWTSLGRVTIDKPVSRFCRIDSNSPNFVFEGDLELINASSFRNPNSNLVVNGNIQINDGTSFWVGGNSPNDSEVVTNGLIIGDHLSIHNGSLTVLNSFTYQASGSLWMLGSTLTIDTPYSGTRYNFAGQSDITVSTIEIPNNGMQLSATSNFGILSAKVSLGWGFMANSPGIMDDVWGTFEFTGTRICDIQMAENNRFYIVQISKTGDSGLVSLSDDVLIEDDLTISSGTLFCNHHTLTINENYINEGGVLSAAYSDDEVRVGESWDAQTGASGFIAGSGKVTFFSENIGEINGNTNFNNVEVNKNLDFDDYLYIGGVGDDISVGGTLDITNGNLKIWDSAQLNVVGNLNLLNSSTIQNRLNTVNCNIHVNGATTISTPATIYVNSGTMVCDGTLNHYGTLDVGDGAFILNGDYVNNSNTNLIVNNGLFSCTTPRNGTWQYMYGHLTMTGEYGIVEFQDRALQFPVSFSEDISAGTIKIGRSFYAASSSVFQPSGGTIELYGDQPADIMCSNGNSMNNLVINKTGVTVGLLSDLDLQRSFTINSGALNSNSRNLLVGGDWLNNVGAPAFIEGTGLVYFQGSESATIFGNETFYNLSVDRDLASDISLLSEGQITILNDLTVISGVLDLEDTADWTVNDNLMIHNGACLNLFGTTGSPLLTLQGDFIDNNTTIDSMHGFYAPANCSLVLNGSGDQYFDCQTEPLYIANLTLQNSCYFYPASSLSINGNLSLEDTSAWDYMEAELIHEVGGNFSMGNDTYWFDDSGSISFIGSNDSEINVLGDAVFEEIIIEKTVTDPQNVPVVSLNSDLYIDGDRFLSVSGGILDLNGHQIATNTYVEVNIAGQLLVGPGSELLLNSGKTMVIGNGGRLIAVGTASEPALIGSQSGYYNFNVAWQGTISASYAIFEDMGFSGINVQQYSQIDTSHSFDHCT